MPPADHAADRLAGRGQSVDLPLGEAESAAQTMVPVAEWRLHLGAHKTATTHLQRTLDALRHRLAPDGVDILLTDDARRVWAEQMRRYRSYRRAHKGLIALGLPPPRHDRARFDSGLAELRTGGATILVSEENIIGEACAAIADPLYPDLVARLGMLRALIGRRARVRLFFAIRDMGDFLPSAYAEALRFFPVDGTFESVLAPALAEPPRWRDVIGRIRRTWPEAPVTVWRYEDYQPNAHAILSRLVGADPGALPAIPRPARTMTPSAAAVRAVEADRRVLNALDYAARVRAVARIYDAAPAAADAPAFRPLTPEQAARCAAVYAADCADLEQEGLLFTP